MAGWVASFDRLLADPLGVQCLLVSVCVGECARTCMGMCVCFDVYKCVYSQKHDFVFVLMCVCLLQNTFMFVDWSIVCINMYVS